MSNDLGQRVDRHVGACSSMARLAGAAAVLGAAGLAAPASGELFYSTTSFYVGYPGPAVFFDVDYSSGTIGVSFLKTATPGDFSLYPDAEFMITIGKFGPTFYDNKTDTKTMYLLSTTGPFSYAGYQYPYKLDTGYTLDSSLADWLSLSGKYFKGEISEPYNASWYGIAGGLTGHVGFKFYDTSDKSTTFGSIYMYVYDLKTYSSPPLPGTSKFTNYFVQWDSTATSITTATSATVPEPGTGILTLIALGAAGLGSWRRRDDEVAEEVDAA